jgi:hypothetical protein
VDPPVPELLHPIGDGQRGLVVGGQQDRVVRAQLAQQFEDALAGRRVQFPGGFVGGVVAWRFVPKPVRIGGLVGGMLSTLVGYAVCWARLLLLGAFYGVIVDPSVVTATDSVLELALLLGFISLYISWATVPVGILTGYLYERTLN